MDIQRFKTVNTAKGPWSLLDLLSSKKITEQKPKDSDQEPEAVKTQIGIADIQRAVREVAAGIIGESLEGKTNLQTVPKPIVLIFGAFLLAYIKYVLLLAVSSSARIFEM